MVMSPFARALLFIGEHRGRRKGDGLGIRTGRVGGQG